MSYYLCNYRDDFLSFEHIGEDLWIKKKLSQALEKSI